MIKLFAGNKRKAEQGEKKVKRSYVFLLEFRCRDRLLVCAKTDSLNKTVKIGRAADNDWIIPEQNRVAADYQAELHLDAKNIRIHASGKNRIYIHGRETAGSILKPGDRVSIGDCELFVSASESRDALPEDVHRLEFRNGPHEGELVRLDKALIRIGSAPANDIVIKDNVVSRFHAEIRITENGESWIRDLNSNNGTFVNGTKLGRQERMLMDSDEISIAFFDLLFLDRNVPHTRSQIGRKILIMGITVAVILLFFWIFYISTQQASQVLAVAEFYIRRADFNEAEKVLNQMSESRDFQRYEKHQQEHLKSLPRYRKTFAAWEEFKNHLSNSEWNDAAECSGRLEIDNRFAWNWEDATVDARMALVRHAKFLLDLQFRIQAALSSVDTEPRQLRKIFLRLKEEQKTVSGKEPEWLFPLLRDIETHLAELERSCVYSEKISEILDRLQDEKTEFKPLIVEIEHLRTVSSGCVRIWAQDISEALKQLEINQREVAANQTALIALRLDEIKKNISFVSPDECMISSRIMAKRDRIVRRQNAILCNAENLRFLLNKLRRAGWTDDQAVPEYAERFTAEKTLKEAFRFECLQRSIPKSSRKTPDGIYDRMFGIRYFYEIMQQSSVLSTNLYSGDIISSLSFQPECIVLAAFFRTVEETGLWLSLPENRWMLAGEIGHLNEKCKKIMDLRSVFLDRLNTMVKTMPETRVYLTAQAAFFYFSPASSIPEKEMKRYAEVWKKFKFSQQEQIEKYDPLKLKEARQIGENILREGIPGDPMVNWVWSQLR